MSDFDGKVIKITAVSYYRPERGDYHLDYSDDNLNGRERTQEEIANLTLEDIIEEEKQNLADGSIALEELMDVVDNDDITMEVVDDPDK